MKQSKLIAIIGTGIVGLAASIGGAYYVSRPTYTEEFTNKDIDVAIKLTSKAADGIFESCIKGMENYAKEQDQRDQEKK